MSSAESPPVIECFIPMLGTSSWW